MDIKIALIGCGYWGKNLARNFAQLDSLSLICDPCESGRDLAVRTVPACPVTGDLDDVLRADDIPAVAVAAPAETHFDIVHQCLEAGKDVFVEKPLALTYEEGVHLVRLAERGRRILMVGHVLEYHPGILRFRELISAGELGKVRYIYSNRLSLGKIRREENILWSFAPHDIAIILRLIGQMPFEVSACGGAYLQGNIPDVTVTNLLFDNGVRAHIFVSWLHPFKEQRLVVIGSRKMASFDDVNKKLILYDQRVEINNGGTPTPIKGDGQEVAYASSEPLRAECEAFLDAIATRTPPLTDGASGLRVLRVLQMAQRSLITNGARVAVAEEAYA
ncbi:MAG: Gfo/Idh/MocA family oxidoreductase [Planctomycetes bacterium]|nr:Gfo/Idh/MocA family oxidoreductase [Planctomycetota bacterium]